MKGFHFDTTMMLIPAQDFSAKVSRSDLHDLEKHERRANQVDRTQHPYDRLATPAKAPARTGSWPWGRRGGRMPLR